MLKHFNVLQVPPHMIAGAEAKSTTSDRSISGFCLLVDLNISILWTNEMLTGLVLTQVSLCCKPCFPNSNTNFTA